MYPLNDTIAALSTPPGPGGIAIVRISGLRALEVGSLLFRPVDAGQAGGENPRKLIHGYIVNPGGGERLDEVLWVYFPGPKSYTAEDTVEIQGHSGPAVSRLVLDMVLSQGVRLAQPGEFTYRALINGRLDLSSSEAVAQIVAAQSQTEARLAMGALDGGLSSRLAPVRRTLLAAAAAVEIALDFPDDMEETGDFDPVGALSAQVVEPLRLIVQERMQRRVYSEGAVVVICGRPNVGKSQLFNAFLGEERTIVDPTPGTTRDTVEQGVLIGGVVCRLVDTAGMGNVKDELDALAQARSRQCLGSADLALTVLDLSEPLTPADEEALVATQEMMSLVICNKADLKPVWDPRILEVPEQNIVRISALQRTGLQKLIKAVGGSLTNGVPEPLPGQVVVNRRQAEALLRCAQAAESAAKALLQRPQAQLELISLELSAALDALGEVDGQGTHDDVFEAVFSQFCVGK